MKFPVNVRVYLKSGEYLGEGKIVKGNNMGFTYNILHNINEHLQGHRENKEKTGFKYGCGIGRWLNDDVDNFSAEKWIKYINEKCMLKYIIVIKNTCSFEEIKL